MTADIYISRDSEHFTLVEAQSDAGIEFVDAYNVPGVSVNDSGSILLPIPEVPALIDAAKQNGLSVHVFEQEDA